MIFIETGLDGAYVIEIEPIADERGFFARSWCAREAADHGIDGGFVQCNISHNIQRGTLRGMHYQHPDWEAKLVRVTRGSIFDVIIDIRPKSRSYLRQFCVVLSAENHKALYVPEGFAHGFLALDDDTEVFYQMSEYFIGEQAKGFRWDDPRFDIPWPEGEKILSDRDRNLPVYQP